MEEKIEENSNQEVEKKQQPKCEIRLTAQVLNVCMAIVAMFLFVLFKILVNFGVYSNVFHGIISLIIYGLTLGGLVWAYVRVKKPTFEFWLNAIVFGLAIWLM